LSAAGGDQHDRAQDGEADDPAREERRPVEPALGCGEHQHHCDDRHRAERDTETEREDLADRLAHQRSWQVWARLLIVTLVFAIAEVLVPLGGVHHPIGVTRFRILEGILLAETAMEGMPG